MAGEGDLGAALDAMEIRHRDLAKIIHDRNGNWRLDLVRARRELAILLGQVGSILSRDIMADRVGRDVLSPVDRDAVRSRLSDFRHALAIHQASYPAVNIDTNDGYLESSRRVLAAHDAFCSLVRRTYDLPPLKS